MAVTVDQTRSGGETYQGIVALEGRTLTDSMLTYFRNSEQVPTGIKVATRRDPAAPDRWYGGAIILQALPADQPVRARGAGAGLAGGDDPPGRPRVTRS